VGGVVAKWTSAEYVKPEAKVSDTWQSPGSFDENDTWSQSTKGVCAASGQLKPSPLTTRLASGGGAQGPVSSALVTDAGAQDKSSVADWGPWQPILQSEPHPLATLAKMSPTSNIPPARTLTANSGRNGSPSNRSDSSQRPHHGREEATYLEPGGNCRPGLHGAAPS
jgi:hypothetical protein